MFENGRHKLGLRNDADDNTFWMSFDDLCLAFHALYVCKWANPATWTTVTMNGQWRSVEEKQGKGEGEERGMEVDTSAGLPSK